MKSSFYFLPLVLALSSLHARPWTEAATGRTMEAEYVSATSDSVTVRRPDGSTAQLPLARLSEADLAFVKQQQSPPPATALLKPKSPAGGGDLKASLLGTWEGFMADSDGSRHGDIKLVITEQEITATNPQGERVMGAGTYAVTEGKPFHRIKASGTSGQFDHKSYEGIFVIEGSTLKWCSANDNPRSKRPEKLQTDVKAGQFLMVLEKK